MRFTQQFIIQEGESLAAKNDDKHMTQPCNIPVILVPRAVTVYLYDIPYTLLPGDSNRYLYVFECYLRTITCGIEMDFQIFESDMMRKYIYIYMRI